VINTFEQTGLHVHTVPLYVFLRFQAKEIINLNYYQIMVDAKFSKTLSLIGYQTKA
jgi:hypothetical protein